MANYELLKKLCNCNGISGDEGSVRTLIINEIKDYVTDFKIDNLGNLLVHKKGSKTPKNKVMLSAHMDEVGLMVTNVTSDGYIKFDEVGGIDKRILIGNRVFIGDNNIVGVIGTKPIHLSKGEEGSAIPKILDMYIDIGADSKEEALRCINYGDSINFSSEFKMTNTAIMAKALDDRFGCLVLIEIIKSELIYDTDFCFVVQEEVGLRGAKTASYSVNPDVALVIETTTASDVPEVEKNNYVCNLGDGAVISIMDKRTIYDKKLVKTAFKVAKNNLLKAQCKKAIAGGNDAGVIHQNRCGVHTLAISLPCRYLHSQKCVANLSDCENTINLVAEMTKTVADLDFD